MTNPLANPDQFAAEADVRAMLETQEIKSAIAQVGNRFRLAYGTDTPADEESRFDMAMKEFVTNYTFKAAVCDGAYPRFTRNFMPAYQWNGAAVPGATMGGDNPDNCYRLAGIAHGGKYRITARPNGQEPSNTSFTLVGNFGTSVTIQTIENWQMKRESDGSFVITIDDQPAGNRSNHLTTAPHVKFLFVRETFDDWAHETSYTLEIERLDKVGTAPVSIEEKARRAAFRAVEDVPLYYWFQRLFTGVARNSIRPPENAGNMGGLVTQAGLQGNFTLAEDEVALIRANQAGAAYIAFQATDWWFRSIEANTRQSSLTRQQCVTDPDGGLSLVVARRDPGIANWMDVGDRATSLFMARWQGLPAIPVDGGPRISSKVMKQSDLPKEMFDHQPMDRAGREQQIAARRADWNRRITI